MIFDEKRIKLKNGVTAILKSPEPGTGVKMLDYIKTACGETDFLARYPEEWEEVSVESEEKWINHGRESQNVCLINCQIDGEIVGNCEIRFRGGAKTCHRATLAIAILKKYWNLGIGSFMFLELLALAEQREGITVVELEFIEGNDRAKALYEKFGFRVVGERPNAFKRRDGSMAREYFMQKML
ncbi:MAG: GNAT family N-acetyltransferase [Clostridia bacterium]|nr:GNAT family N-acetyltransferase [Clostridia bacterium]